MTRSEERLREALGDELAEHLMTVVPGRYFYVPNGRKGRKIGRPVSNKRDAWAVELFQAGVAVTSIVKFLGIKKSRVYQILADSGVKRDWKRRAKGRQIGKQGA